MRVYVAGPFTEGGEFVNVRKAVDAANGLLDAGHTPFVPHLTAFLHFVKERSYEDWLSYDFRWLRQCEAIVRLTHGVSLGSDREEELANEIGIPIYYSVESFLAAYGKVYDEQG